ncbi:MAG: hypothetical protein C4548_02010 [Desulfobacteraceae bacterium]|jgi:hypothetical protein|nr:MAG: hypothetical protein C4548_02010 [Desulfobacteraceae bacterium]
MNIILKSFYVIFLLLLISCMAGAEVTPWPKAFIDQTTHAFAPVIAGAEVIHHFNIANQGGVPLNIVGVQTG